MVMVGHIYWAKDIKCNGKVTNPSHSTHTHPLTPRATVHLKTACFFPSSPYFAVFLAGSVCLVLVSDARLYPRRKCCCLRLHLLSPRHFFLLPLIRILAQHMRTSVDLVPNSGTLFLYSFEHVGRLISVHLAQFAFCLSILCLCTTIMLLYAFR